MSVSLIHHEHRYDVPLTSLSRSKLFNNISNDILDNSSFHLPDKFTVEVIEEYVYYLNNSSIRNVLLESMILADFVDDSTYARLIGEKMGEEFHLYRQKIKILDVEIQEFIYLHLPINILLKNRKRLFTRWIEENKEKNDLCRYEYYISFYEDASLRDIDTYIKDVLIHRLKWKGGRKSFVGEYDEDGRKHGLHKRWKDSGRPYIHSVYCHGELVEEKKWFSNDKLAYHFIKENNRTIIKEFYRRGSIRRYYDSSSEEYQWKLNGNLSSFVELKDGKRNGEYRSFYDNGKVNVIVNYKLGEKDGYYFEWSQDGRPKIFTNFKEGKKDGPFLKWIPYASVIETNFKEDKLHGLYNIWGKFNKKFFHHKQHLVTGNSYFLFNKKFLHH